MAEVYAGFICGFALALTLTPLLAVALFRLRGSSETLARLLPSGTSVVGLSVVLHLGVVLATTGAGIVLGIVLKAMDSGRQVHVLFSHNAAFTLLVAGFVIAIVAPFVVVLPRVRSATLAGGLIAVIVFGWLMPFLATQSNFG